MNKNKNKKLSSILIPIIAVIIIGLGYLYKSDLFGSNGNQNIETVSIEPDTIRMLRNPLNGWVVYGTALAMPDFWNNYDNMNVPSLGKSVKVSDYANTLYIRMSWTELNPEDGVYGWNTNAELQQLIQGAQDRKMKLAFRVVEDSRDKRFTFTPEFVKKAGAKGYENKGKWSPYPDDPIFQKYFEKFVQAFAEEFNNPAIVDFIDGFSLGKWGEYHTVLYSTGNETPRKAVFEWQTDLYAKYFTKVPIVINYHRWIGTGKDWTNDAEYDAESEGLLLSAIQKGYSLRHDAFGMGTYYGSWERKFAEKYRYTAPIIMEGGWIVKQHHSYWTDPREYRKDFPGDVRRGEFEDAKEAHVNMIDFRYRETESWFEDAFDLVQKFITEGGYRLYPDKILLPKKLDESKVLKIQHRWNNLGWGYCPTNIPQWNQKYKVAFALLDESGELKYTFVDSKTDLSKWLKDKPTEYNFEIDAKDIKSGKYTWAVGLVDTTLDNQIGIEIAAKGDYLPNGWYKLYNIEI